MGRLRVGTLITAQRVGDARGEARNAAGREAGKAGTGADFLRAGVGGLVAAFGAVTGAEGQRDRTRRQIEQLAAGAAFDHFLTDLTRSADAAVLFLDLANDDGPTETQAVIDRLKAARRLLVKELPAEEDPATYSLRTILVATKADDEAADRARLRAWLEKSGYSKQIQSVENALTTRSVWGAEPEAAAEDVLSTWHQLVTLHRKEHSLLRELKDAELALSEAQTEANFAWLKDVNARLESVEGTEALIEGFGESSGRIRTTT